jgi:hypothetical protein
VSHGTEGLQTSSQLAATLSSAIIAEPGEKAKKTAPVTSRRRKDDGIYGSIRDVTTEPSLTAAMRLIAVDVAFSKRPKTRWLRGKVDGRLPASQRWQNAITALATTMTHHRAARRCASSP